MDISYETILTSPIFVFRIGKAGTEMMLPKALVACQSPSLNSLVNGAMSEASNGTACLDDVDEFTFARFGQWLYTGKYEVRRANSIQPEAQISTHVPWDEGLTLKERRRREKQMRLEGTWTDRVVEDYPHEDPQPGDCWGQPAYSAMKKSKRDQAWSDFTQQSSYVPPIPPRAGEMPNYPDVTQTLLDHAKLYCFADKYGISKLSTSCLRELKLSLLECECQDSQLQGIAELLAFTTENTPSLSGREDQNLRSVVMAFVVIIYEFIAENETFQELLENNGTVAKEFLLALRQRLD